MEDGTAGTAYPDLEGRGLLPPATMYGAAELGLEIDPLVDYAACFRGALLGGAIGDALGRPHEGRRDPQPGEGLEDLRAYTTWRGWRAGPQGTITDDTQMTICVAETIVECGDVNPADLAKRFIAWLPTGRGKGQACVAAVERLRGGISWDHAGVESAGNGAAMRVAPVGLRYPREVHALRHDAAISAVVTHADQTAVVSAVAQAFAVAYCLHQSPGTLDPAAFLTSLASVLSDLNDPPLSERRPDRTTSVRLRDRIAEVGDLLDATPTEAFAHFYNGAFVLESLPAALWCFLCTPEEPDRVILTAVSGGYDADTVAAMAGALAGAYHGDGVFKGPWLAELEYADELRRLANSLFELSGLRPTV